MSAYARGDGKLFIVLVLFALVVFSIIHLGNEVRKAEELKQQEIFVVSQKADLEEYFSEGVKVIEIRLTPGTMRSWKTVAIVVSISHPEKRQAVRIHGEHPATAGDLWSLFLDEEGNYQLGEMLKTPQGELSAEVQN